MQVVHSNSAMSQEVAELRMSCCPAALASKGISLLQLYMPPITMLVVMKCSYEVSDVDKKSEPYQVHSACIYMFITIAYLLHITTAMKYLPLCKVSTL